MLAVLSLAGCFRTERPHAPSEERPVVVMTIAPPVETPGKPAATPRAEASPPPARPAEDRAAVKAIQRALVDAGYAPGYPDGVWGTNTRRAYAGFEAAAGLEADGMPDSESLRALFAPDKEVEPDEIQRVRGETPSRTRGFARTFALGAGVGFLLAALLTAIALLRQRAAAS